MGAPRILIVEDDAILVTHLARTLVQLGYSVAGMAATGESAVGLALREKPDAILMDINLRGGMTGIQAAEKIRRQADTPIVYLTAYTDEALLQEAKATEAYAYLVKPVRDRELRAGLEMALYKHASERTVAHLNRVLRAIRDINQLITREHEPQRLLDDACQILVNTRGYALAWIGRAETEGKRIVPVARAGPHTDFLDTIRVTWDSDTAGNGPTGRAFRTGEAVVFRELATHPDYGPWREEALKRGFVQSAAIPMRNETKLYGVLNVYANTPSVFSDEEIELLREVANDLAFALKTLDDERERRRAEEALFREHEIVSRLLETTPLGVTMVNADGVITYANKRAESILGIARSAIFGRTYDDPAWKITDFSGGVFPPENLPFSIVKSTGNPVHAVRHALEKADGTRVLLSINGAPLLGKEGAFEGMVATLEDITEKIRLETERETLEKRLQQAQKLDSLGVLAGGIAHDFNNLLSGIFGYIEIACMASRDEGVSRDLGKALSSIDRARGLTQQLLTFAKGGNPVRATGSLFPAVEEEARFALSGSNVSCRFEVPKDLWKCDFDKAQIGQVIGNIVLNAQQAMPMGGTVVISASNVSLGDNEFAGLAGGDYVKVSIRDTGIGIPSEILPRIFDPFFSTKQKGSGLGLATSYSIVKRHDGMIDVESQPGMGSVFHLYLPASHAALAEDQEKTAAMHTGGGRILVMDDDDAIREIAKWALESFGYSVVTCKDGKDALASFLGEKKAGRPFVAVILDLTVPGGMGGKETAEEIRKADPVIPLFVASGYAEDPVLNDPGRFGFTAGIRKPFSIKDLSELLGTHLGKGEFGARA